MSLPQLAGYNINFEFASGGMAKIYDAIQVSLDRPVAIKFLNQDLSDHPEAQALFESESLIIAKLNHPNIVQVIDKGITKDSQPYFVMEKIVGINLALMLDGGELPMAKKLDIAIQICKGLSYAHRNGIIHRDIKPSNIIIDQHGHVKILDFGIAMTNKDVSNNMQKSSVMGTLGYVSPEQREDYSNANIVSDIYSVGIVFYDLFGTQVDSHKEKKSPQRLLGLPENLLALINKCCEEQPGKRYQSLDQVRDELLNISQGSHLGQSNVQEIEKENKDLSSNFNLLDILKKTSKKRVYLFQKKANRQLIVIKRYVGTQGLKQAQYLSSLKHPNIINVLAAVENNYGSTIITEYLSGGTLTNALIQQPEESEFLFQAQQISSAIFFAHQNKILHSNLSPDNILFDADQNLKIGSFGQIDKNHLSRKANRNYRPKTQEKFSTAYDVYSMGAIFYHMLYGAAPGKKLPPLHKKISFRLSSLIEKMLAHNPAERPVAGEVLTEIQRMASKYIEDLPSKIGLAQETLIPKMKVANSVEKIIIKNSPWLLITLGVSLFFNIIFLIKFYLIH